MRHSSPRVRSLVSVVLVAVIGLSPLGQASNGLKAKADYVANVTGLSAASSVKDKPIKDPDVYGHAKGTKITIDSRKAISDHGMTEPSSIAAMLESLLLHELMHVNFPGYGGDIKSGSATSSVCGHLSIYVDMMDWICDELSILSALPPGTVSAATYSQLCAFADAVRGTANGSPSYGACAFSWTPPPGMSSLPSGGIPQCPDCP